VEGVQVEEIGAAAAVPAVAFTGRRRALLALLVKNLTLSSLTLGVYRFWAKTRIRQFFWSAIAVGGEPLEYTGKGSELLVGFLIVLAVLAPLTLAYMLIDALSVGAPTAVRIGLQAAYYAGFAFLVEVALFRARRYRLTRTLWRAVRFGQDGSWLEYALVAFGQRALVFLTLGLSEPWRAAVVQRRLMTATRFGDRFFSFAGRGSALMRWYWPAWLALWGSVALLLLLNAEALASVAKTLSAYEVAREPPDFDVDPTLWPLAGLVAAWLLYTRYRVRQIAYFAGATSLGATTFVSGLRTRRIIGYYAVYGLIGLAWLAGLIGIFVALGPSTGDPRPWAIAALAAFFLITFIAAPMVRIAWLLFSIVGEFCRTLEIRNLEAVETIVQARRDVPGYGEGLADALDVGGL
jgi:uncharacterized membrane protein YjgN (DUF898 family)